MSDLADRITEYLSNGGLFNPELMDHCAVRDLLIECRKKIIEQQNQIIETEDRIRANWHYHRYWEEKFARHLDKIREWENEEADKDYW